MSPERRRLALRASSAALRMRQQARIAADQPCSVFDLAIELGIDVRLAPLPSAEGIYSPDKPAIVISSLRPPGRQAFTCAHELGHHAYGHGEQFDELVEDRAITRRSDPKEFEAECFASALLMPKTAVMRGLAARNWTAKSLTAEQAYQLACWLGVGYSTLIANMDWGLNLVEKDKAEALGKIKPPSIRKSLLGAECKEHLIAVDSSWTGRAVDAQVGNFILLPAEVALEGENALVTRRSAEVTLVQAVAPGIGRAVCATDGWAQYIRVSKKQFAGLARFRHLAEVEDE